MVTSTEVEGGCEAHHSVFNFFLSYSSVHLLPLGARAKRTKLQKLRILALAVAHHRGFDYFLRDGLL